MDRITTSPTLDPILPSTTKQTIIPGAAEQRIRFLQTPNDIVAAQAVYPVRVRRPAKIIGHLSA
jgi:hypothetical protein